MGKPPSPRLSARMSDRVREVALVAKEHGGFSSWRDMEKSLGFEPQWIHNTLHAGGARRVTMERASRTKRIAAHRALTLLERLAENARQRPYLDASVLAGEIRNYVMGVSSPPPLAIPSKSVRALRHAFELWSRSRGYDSASEWARRLANFLEEVREPGAIAFLFEVPEFFRARRRWLNGREITARECEDAVHLALGLTGCIRTRKPSAEELARYRRRYNAPGKGKRQ